MDELRDCPIWRMEEILSRRHSVRSSHAIISLLMTAAPFTQRDA